jgi:hypothetical protein
LDVRITATEGKEEKTAGLTYCTLQSWHFLVGFEENFTNEFNPEILNK